MFANTQPVLWYNERRKGEKGMQTTLERTFTLDRDLTRRAERKFHR